MEIKEVSPLISVILPVFNEEAYIERAVKSILVQTYQNIEIIIVNDGSTDCTEKICQKLLKKDKRILLINKDKNEGVSSARNRGIQSASGKYLAFLDADDYCKADYIKKMYECLIRDNSDLCVCGYYSVFPNQRKAVTYNEIKEKYLKYSREEAESALIKGYIGYHLWGKLYKTEIIKKIICPLGKTYEDVYTFPAILDLCRNVSVIKERLVMYTQKKDSIVHRQDLESEYCAFDAEFRVFQKYKKKHPDLAAYLLCAPVSVALRLKFRCLLSKENRSRINYGRIKTFLKTAKKKKASYLLLSCKYRAALLLLG